MKVVHFSLADTLGGAAKTANRLHCALLDENIDSSMLVIYKTVQDETIHRATGPALLSRVLFQATR